MAAPALVLVIGEASGDLSRHVGPNAWVVLEELLLGATIEESVGHAVSRATVRALATRTGLSKDTVSRSLHKLRAAKVVRVEAERHDDSGRFVSVRYVVDLRHMPLRVRAVVSQASGPAPAPTPARTAQRQATPPASQPMKPLAVARLAVAEQLSILAD